MKEISNVKEFSGEEKFKSVKNMISENEAAGKKEILQYLKSFEPDCSAGMILVDELTGKEVGSEVNGYEDGQFYWDSRHIYHFEKYNLELNKEFIEKVLNRKG